MQTALHILALVNQLKAEVIGSPIVGTEFYKKERSAYLIIKAKQRLALSFVYHPVRWGTYLVPASKLNISTREKPWPIFDLVGANIIAVEQMGVDRIFKITIERDKRTSYLVFEAIGPNGNIWWLNQQGQIAATLRKKSFESGDEYQPHTMVGKLSPIDVSVDELSASLSENDSMSVAAFVERYVIGCNRTIAREIAHRADLTTCHTDELNRGNVESLLKVTTQLASAFRTSETGYLYEIKGGFEAYPFKLASSDKQPQRFKTLSLAVMAAAESRHTVAIEEDEEKTITDSVRRAIKRLEKRLVNIEKDIVGAANYEEYQKMGELLQINHDKIKKGLTSITVQDVYSDTPAELEIKLDPALSPHENTESYFKRARKGREGLETVKRRLTVTQAELEQLREIRSDLEADFDSAQERYRQEILSLMPAEATARETIERLPYREFLLSTGVKIFVGRDGSDNDRTTFEFARPYELWFHTQQCPGSHVVMKFPNKAFEPSKREIEETAAVAAYYSKARNDSLVPVIYTPRKYVRKPRKAKPGLVTVEREKSVMVVPTQPTGE